MAANQLESPIYFSKSAIPNVSTIYVELVIDDVLDVAILRDKFTALVAAAPVLGGEWLVKTDSRMFTCGSLVDFASRTIDQDVQSYLAFPWDGGAKPSILHDDISSIREKFLFDASVHESSTCKLRATILKDTSLLCFSIPHGLADGQSCLDILQSFCDLLSNKPIRTFSLPPDAAGFRHSELIKLATDGESDPDPQDDVFHVRGRLRSLWTFGYAVTEKILEDFGVFEKFTTKLVHLPGPWVEEVHDRAQRELDNADENTGIQLSKNDIIAAWFMKSIYGHQNSWRNSASLYVPINYRPEIRPPEGHEHYIHHGTTLLRCEIPRSELRTESLAKIARRIRLSVLKKKQAGAIRRQIRFIEEKVGDFSGFGVQGNLKWGMTFVSPWTTFDYQKLDFSGASCRGGQGRPVFVHPDVVSPTDWLVTSMITQKDGSGGYWLRARSTPSSWREFDYWTCVDNLFPVVNPDTK